VPDRCAAKAARRFPTFELCFFVRSKP